MGSAFQQWLRERARCGRSAHLAFTIAGELIYSAAAAADSFTIRTRFLGFSAWVASGRSPESSQAVHTRFLLLKYTGHRLSK